MKKALALFMVVAMIFALCACGETQSQQQQQQQQQPIATATPAETGTNPSEPISQVNLIFNNINAMRADEQGRTFWYTVTDIDHNGRLEFIAAITEGTGNYTTVHMYEVNATFDGINEVNLNLADGKTMPEIILTTVDTIKDASGIYHYIYTDTDSSAINNGGHYMTEQALSLNAGVLKHDYIAFQDIQYINGYTVYTTYDGNGTEQDPTKFSAESAIASLYPNGVKSTTNFDWFTFADAMSPARLFSSYSAFAGNTPVPVQPAVTPAPVQPVVTPAPTSNIHIVDVSNPKITKNPTSESLQAGGSCTFIAQAIGYNYMRWQLVAPNGAVYDAASSNPYPANLFIYGATGQTLTLSGVPYDMDGWKVQAVFTGDTESVTTQPAYIYVSPAPVPVYVYITFSPGQETTFYDTVTYVNVYSSTGEDIRVEAIMGGDTGPYYSGTVRSGGSFPVQGVYGQFLPVNVYATCGNSQSNATFYVDCTPVPTPPPVPVDNCMNGVVVDYLMSSVTIRLDNGSTVQVLKDICTVGPGSLAIGAPATVFYYGYYPDSSNVYSVYIDGLVG